MGNASASQTALFDASDLLKSVPSLAPGGQTKLMKEFGYDDIVKCMRCGYCLAVCPTYKETYSETASPRGRINLVQATAEGILTFNDNLQEKLDLCLGCRACETACPAGVNYGRIHEKAKTAIKKRVPQPWFSEKLQNLLFDHVFPYPGRLRFVVNLLWLYQRSGLRSLVRATGLLKLFPGDLSEIEKLQPVVAPPAKRKPVPVQDANKAVGPDAPRVGMFRGCIMEAAFSETNWSTYLVLGEAGTNLVAPQDQACCGALHAHTGDLDAARDLARQNIEAFEKARVDYVVVNAAGCGAMLKDYHHLLEDDPVWHERALDFVRKVRDFSELMADLPRPARGQNLQPLSAERMEDLGLEWWPQVVTYQDACHLAHGQGVRQQPRELLKDLPVEVRPLRDADTCCGSAGIYNIVQHEMSMKVLDRKMETIKETAADTVVTANPGCYLQLKHGIERHDLADKVQVVHIADLLEAFAEANIEEPAAAN